jgi:DNA-binding protein HU-beta
MNKAELIAAVAKCAELSKVQAERAINCYNYCVSRALEKEDSVRLLGFGSFLVSKRSARQGRNPQNGKAMRIPAKKVVKFRAGSALSAKISK